VPDSSPFGVWIYEFGEGQLVKARVYADTAVLRDTGAGITSD